MEKKQAISLLLISIILIVGIFLFSIQQNQLSHYTGFGIFNKLLTKAKIKFVLTDKQNSIPASNLSFPTKKPSLIFPTTDTTSYIGSSNLKNTKMKINVQNTAYFFDIIRNAVQTESCKNGKKDIGETDIDCGGLCDKCIVNRECESNNDCLTGTCKRECITTENRRTERCEKICKEPSCKDGIKNQKETGIDCGGSCRPCVRCIDTDPQDDVYVLGQSTDRISGRQITDTCIDDFTVKQVICGIKDYLSYGEPRRCPDGTACVAGICASINNLGCSDTDPTNNLYLQGNVIDRTNTQGVDHCGENSNVVIQGFCNNGLLGWRNTNCPQGERCDNGICRPEPNLCQVPNPGQYVQDGTVFEDHGNPHIDYCADDHTVTHITCNRIYELTSQTPCSGGTTCNSGLCGREEAESHCIDTDPQDNVYVPGVVVSDNRYTLDNCDCSSNFIVHQVSCSSRGDILNIDTECPEGLSCFSGICQEISNCVDTDPENNPYIKGERTQAGSTELDRCNEFNRLVLFQYVCGSSCSSYEQCPDGTYCSDGACVRGQPECTDTDGGGDNEEFVRGDILLNGEHVGNEDVCNSETELIERGCNGFNLREEIIQREGYYCSNGRLVNCLDTDLENYQRVLGYITDTTGRQHSDYCVGNQIVQLDCQEDGTRIARPQQNCNPIYGLINHRGDRGSWDIYVRYNARCSAGICVITNNSSYTEVTQQEYYQNSQ